MFINPAREGNCFTENLETEGYVRGVVTYDMGECRISVIRAGSRVAEEHGKALMALVSSVNLRRSCQ